MGEVSDDRLGSDHGPDLAPVSATELLAAIARNHVQLYNQLQRQGRPSRDLSLVRRAYELSAKLYSGAYQADGRPFVLHVVAVASTVALLGLPSTFVAAALLHNVYTNADFGDGRDHAMTRRRRALVRAAVGEDVEELIGRFAELRVDRHLDDLLAAAPGMAERDRHLITMDLADLLEKHLDGGVLYFGDHTWVTGFATKRLPDLVALAGALGQPALGEALRLAVEQAAELTVDPVLRSPSEQRYLRFVLPLSARRSIAVVLRRSRAWRRLALIRRRCRRKTKEPQAL